MQSRGAHFTWFDCKPISGRVAGMYMYVFTLPYLYHMVKVIILFFIKKLNAVVLTILATILGSFEITKQETE